MRRGGFTLIELMIASAISLAVLAGGLVATTQLQRRAVLEGRTAATQGALASLQDVLSAEFARAGSGSGSARLTFGATDTYAIDVKSNEAFAADSSFAPPPPAYTSNGGNLTSDFVEIWSSDATAALSVVRCPSSKVRQGDFLCTSGAWPESMIGRNFFAVNPSKRRGCVFEVQAVTGGPSANAIKVDHPHGAAAGAAASLCGADFASSTDPEVVAFWDSDELLLMPAASRAFRVNWKSGSPVLEIDPDGTREPARWQALSRNIEQMKVRLGLQNLAAPAAALSWYPDPAAGNLEVDRCPGASVTPTPGCALPGGAAVDSALDESSVRDALMHRVRNVEVAFTARAGVFDSEQVAKTGSTFLLDEEQNRRDGFKRRTFVLRVTPRNFAYLRN